MFVGRKMVGPSVLKLPSVKIATLIHVHAQADITKSIATATEGARAVHLGASPKAPDALSVELEPPTTAQVRANLVVRVPLPSLLAHLRVFAVPQAPSPRHRASSLVKLVHPAASTLAPRNVDHARQADIDQLHRPFTHAGAASRGAINQLQAAPTASPPTWGFLLVLWGVWTKPRVLWADIRTSPAPVRVSGAFWGPTSRKGALPSACLAPMGGRPISPGLRHAKRGRATPMI